MADDDHDVEDIPQEEVDDSTANNGEIVEKKKKKKTAAASADGSETVKKKKKSKPKTDSEDAAITSSESTDALSAPNSNSSPKKKKAKKKLPDADLMTETESAISDGNGGNGGGLFQDSTSVASGGGGDVEVMSAVAHMSRMSMSSSNSSLTDNPDLGRVNIQRQASVESAPAEYDSSRQRSVSSGVYGNSRSSEEQKSTSVYATMRAGMRQRSPSAPMPPPTSKDWKDWFKKKQSNDMLAESAEEADDGRVFNENGELVLLCGVIHGIRRPIAGTVDGLVDRLAPKDAQDMDYIKTFLLTFRHFTDAQALMEILLSKLQSTSPDNTPEVRYRLVNFLKKWIDSCWFDFDFFTAPEMETLVKRFIDQVKIDDVVRPLQGQLQSTLDQHMLVLQDKRKHAEQNMLDAEKQREKPISDAGKKDLHTINLQVLARQLTLVEFSIFKKVHPQEFMMYLWHNKQNYAAQDLTPNLDAYTEWFNRISYWAGTEICTTPILKDRITKLDILINLLKILLDINNFNVSMAVYSGLHSAAVLRLKQTWEGINSKSKQIMAEMEQIMNPAGNYQKYRELANSKASSFVPFFGLVLKDLTFANDGNPKMLENGLVNFQKMWILADLVQKISLFQGNSFKFEKDEGLFDYCQHLVALSEDRLYKYSLVCEPRQQAEGHSTVRMVEKWNDSGNFLSRWLKD